MHMYWFNYKILFGSQWKTIKCQLWPQPNKLLVYKLQPLHPKQNQKQIMHESNKLCMLQTGEKAIVRDTLPWVLDDEN